MKRPLIGILFLWAAFAGPLRAQTAADSLAIVSATWHEEQVHRGITHRWALFGSLYRGAQSVNVLVVDPRAGLRVGLGLPGKRDYMSRRAEAMGALAALNGSFFDMKHENSVCYLRTGKQVRDTTTADEFRLRVTGAVRLRRGRLEILPWSPEVEKSYRGRRGTLLASGPLMLADGAYSDWSRCDAGFVQAKHPRSAVCVDAEGRVWLVTVDGRFPGRAEGMSIPELAHLLKVLGAEDALNLDGGGSTALWLRGAPQGGVLNYPCDNRVFDHRGERTVPNFLYVYSE